MENLHPVAQVVSVLASSIVAIVFILSFFTSFFDKK
jgi:hypothetical protein